MEIFFLEEEDDDRSIESDVLTKDNSDRCVAVRKHKLLFLVPSCSNDYS